jgi:hypothetical protein
VNLQATQGICTVRGRWLGLGVRFDVHFVRAADACSERYPDRGIFPKAGGDPYDPRIARQILSAVSGEST